MTPKIDYESSRIKTTYKITGLEGTEFKQRKAAKEMAVAQFKADYSHVMDDDNLLMPDAAHWQKSEWMPEDTWFVTIESFTKTGTPDPWQKGS